MTISSTVRIAGPYIGSGAATVFPFAFKVFAAAEMQVAKLNTTSNVETILVLNTDYTVQLNGDQNGTPGGTITLPAVLASGYNLTITSDIANLQPTDLTNQGGFYPEVITDALDRATIQIQQLDQNSRAIKIPLSDGVLDMTTPVVSARQGKYLAFDSLGLPVVSSGTGSDSALRTDLANATAVSAGSGLSGFRQTGTGATARTVDTKLKDTVSIKDFGAVGDGVTDDTTAFQTALATSKSLYIPDGTYNISTQLNIPSSFLIFGNGNKSIINYIGTGVCFFINTQYSTLSNFVITTPYPQGLITGGQTGIKLVSSAASSIYITIEKVTVSNFYSSGVLMEGDNAVGANGPWHITLNDCLIATNHLYGLKLYNSPSGGNLNNIYINNCGFESNGDNANTSIEIDGGLCITLQNCIIESGLTTQINIKGSPSLIRLENLYFESSGGSAPIIFSGAGTCTGLSITGCYIGAVSLSPGNTPIRLADAYVINQCVIKNNVWYSQGDAFIGTLTAIPALIYNSYIGENVRIENGITQTKTQLYNNANTATFFNQTVPSTTHTGWNRFGAFNAKTTATQAAHLLSETGVSSIQGNQLAWYRWDNPIYYVGISYDEISDGLSFNTLSNNQALFIHRTNSRVGIGTVTPGYQLTLSTDSAAKPSTNTWTISSDQRLKENIISADLDRCYDIVKTIPLRRFTWKNEVYTTDQVADRSKLGWIAQEIKEVFPKAVSTTTHNLNSFVEKIEEYQEQDFTIKTHNELVEEIKIIDGVPTLIKKTIVIETKELKWESKEVYDENGIAVCENGMQKFYPVPKMVTKTRTKNVQNTIDDCLDLNSDQIYAAMYGAIQKLQIKLEELQVIVTNLLP